MIGIVIVSHSARLAEGVCELVRQVARGQLRVAAAGGTADPENPIGTDAFRVRDAILSVFSEDGVLVLMDLGSAVLSAETALEFLEEGQRPYVRLCPAPLVEGAVAAASLAAAGAGLEEVAAEARNALAAKTGPVEAAPAAPGQGREAIVKLTNRLGLHARPAAKLVRMARQYRAQVTLENLTRDGGAAAGDSINGVMGLGAREGHELRIRVQGSEAREALAALVAFVESGCGDVETAGGKRAEPQPLQGAATDRQLPGIGAAEGIAVGPLVKLRPAAVDLASEAVADPAAERRRLQAAIEGAREETRALYEWALSHVGADEAGIFDAQMLLLEDPDLMGRSGTAAAWQVETAKLADRLRSLDDPYLRARAADVADVAARVLWRLAGQTGAARAIEGPAIVTAHDLTPSEVKEFDPAKVLGVCLETGTASAHSVILARALGIPVVTGLGPGIGALAEGTLVAMDGEQGTVWISPDAAEVSALEERRRRWLAARHAEERERHRPAATRDGCRIRVLANISGVEEAAEAVAAGAEGAGVLRTEFLFLGRASAPDEEEQAAAYIGAAERLGGRPLTIRVLDIGGDKRLPYVDTGEEANPFLGWRGIRVMLSRRDLFRTQIRAILRAGAAHEVEMLLPMIASLEELRAAKAAIAEAEAELEGQGMAFRRQMRVGVMIEVPAAVAAAGLLAREANFFSIGSNDLVQYLMAADRTNARVAAMADPFQPAVLRTLQQAIEAGRGAGIEVALCGELAADPLATPLLLGLGLREFSVSAPLIPRLKRAIARWSTEEAERLAGEALALDSSRSVKALLRASRPTEDPRGART